jgi:4-alpha-glucanotransferase
MPPTARLERSHCVDIDAAVTPEWLLSNGIGGYAGGTVSGILNRRYHGLLVAPLFPPLGRYLVFAKADAVALPDSGEEVALHSNRWGGGVVEPRGHENIEAFYLDGHIPVWLFRVGAQQLEQRIWMDHGCNCTRMAFRLRDSAPGQSLRLRIGLIASYRDHHAVNGHPAPRLQGLESDDGVQLHLPNGQVLSVRTSGGRFIIDESWIENVFLATEHERGLEDIDRHPRIGFLEIEVDAENPAGISIALGSPPPVDLATSLETERQRINQVIDGALPGIANDAAPAWVRQLVIASDAFLFKRQGDSAPGHDSVIAGYPWFGDWGRDTMIALPGLTLATGRAPLARAILDTFAGYVSRGMLPNVFPGRGEEPEYNTVDAALWFIEAWRTYLDATGDLATIRRVFPTLVRIIAAYRTGTRYGITMDPADGLIRAGEPGQQLTWMDARADGREVTPRHGKPVEINALWFNALRCMQGFAEQIGAPPDAFADLAGKTAIGFARFDRGDSSGLFDVIDGPDGDDPSIRPNQILALSLPHSPVKNDALRQRIIEECRHHLLTPFGLRSLSPTDPRYQGHYVGSVSKRDASYHQGPAWGWLLGHFALAHYRTGGSADAAQALLEPMAGQLNEAAIGQLSEIFDGEAPHLARGAPAQAWTVACTLEAWWRLELAKQSLSAKQDDNERRT